MNHEPLYPFCSCLINYAGNIEQTQYSCANEGKLGGDFAQSTV